MEYSSKELYPTHEFPPTYLDLENPLGDVIERIGRIKLDATPYQLAE